jgi:nucleotide sugar dehydrogenase
MLPVRLLAERLDRRQATIAVVGVGYVGVATTAQLLSLGFSVDAVEREATRRRALVEGPWPFPDDAGELEALVRSGLRDGRLRVSGEAPSDVDVWILCTETPAPLGVWDSEPLSHALARVLSVLERAVDRSSRAECATDEASETWVVVQSTLPVGTMKQRVIPAFQHLARRPRCIYAPVRVMPGALLENTRGLRRVVGVAEPAKDATSPGDATSAGDERVVVSQVLELLFGAFDLADMATTELVKLAENAYRDTQIAFANELSGLCEQAGVDFWRARDLINAVPGRAVALAGPGVGGACLPKDTWLLHGPLAPLGEVGGDRDFAEPVPSMLRTARAVNAAMPTRIVQALRAALGQPLAMANIGVLGLTYRENSSITRDSPARAVVAQLQDAGARLVLHDPAAAPGAISRAFEEADVVLILVRHREYACLDWRALGLSMRGFLVYDGCGLLGAQELKGTGLLLCGLGRNPLLPNSAPNGRGLREP